MAPRIDIPADRIAAFCERWKIADLSLFGSVLRDDFGPDSDVDVLVGFRDDARHGFAELADMEEELKALFGREVDLVQRAVVEKSPNWIRRKSILGSAELVHGS